VFRRASADDSGAVRRAYAALEVPPGSDFETVRRAYRTLMRKYHPDLHTSTPEKQKAANEIAQKLTDSYKLLEKRLRR
jgi:curved DNA-binding protein CbpA